MAGQYGEGFDRNSSFFTYLFHKDLDTMKFLFYVCMIALLSDCTSDIDTCYFFYIL